MSLGSEIAPHLPFLRRFGRALTGSQHLGDAFVSYVVRSVAENPEALREFDDTRVGLYRLFHNAVSDPPPDVLDQLARGGSPDDQVLELTENGPEAISRRRLGRLTTDQREALLLTSLEGFSTEDAGRILDVSPAGIDVLVAGALEEIERQTHANILIIEDEPIIAMDLSTIVRDLGHQVAGVAVTRKQAVQMATDDVGLVLADIELADGSSGIDAVADILSRKPRPIIFVTAFPERLLTQGHPEPTFLITKPFQRSTIKAAISQALFFDAATVPPIEPPPATTDTDKQGTKNARRRSFSDLAPRLAPIDANVINGQLKLAPSDTLGTTLSVDSIEAVRQLHLPTATRLCEEMRTTNVGTAVLDRLNAIMATLSEPLSPEGSIRLGIQTAGINRMLGSISEVVDPIRVTDLGVFTRDLLQLARQFPAYRQFLRETKEFEEVTQESVDPAVNLAAELAKQPDEVIDPKLKSALGEVTSLAVDQPDAESQFALFRSLGNILRAIGRWLQDHAEAIGAETKRSFHKGMGMVSGWGLVTILAGGPILWSISQLVSMHPKEFSFLVELLKVAKEITGLS